MEGVNVTEEVLKKISDRILHTYAAWKEWDGGTGFDEETGEVDESEENALLREMRQLRISRQVIKTL